MFMFVISSITVSFILMSSSHPVAILSLILTQTLLVCLTSWVLMKTSWFSFILFLIFLGGLMVLFVYITSLASNEKFNLEIFDASKKNFYMLILLTMIFLTNFFMNKVSKINVSATEQFNLIFTKMLSMTTMMTMIYLLLTLVVAVKITSKFEGPLRNIIKK